MKRIEVNKNNFRRVGVAIRTMLFVLMLVFSYVLSDRFIDYIFTVDPITLKRIINILLVILTVSLYYKNEK